ncbi:hypothetical protein BDK51DRAFT_34774, partial [Blyttiomyces helicus]
MADEAASTATATNAGASKRPISPTDQPLDTEPKRTKLDTDEHDAAEQPATAEASATALASTKDEDDADDADDNDTHGTPRIKLNISNLPRHTYAKDLNKFFAKNNCEFGKVKKPPKWDDAIMTLTEGVSQEMAVAALSALVLKGNQLVVTVRPAPKIQ